MQTADDLFSPRPWSLSKESSPQRYLLATLTVLLIGWPLYVAGDWVSDDNEMLLYLGSGIFGALYLGRGPARMASLTCLFILHVARIHPGFRVPVQGFQYLISCAFFLLVTDQIARLADNGRWEAWQARRREKAGDILRRFAQQCSELECPEQLDQLLSEKSAPFCAGQGWQGHLSQAPGPRSGYAWFAAQDKDADLGLQVVRSMVDHLALAKERLQHRERVRQADVLQATQKLQATLINSISHDLQTPLSTIVGTIDALRLADQTMVREDRQELLLLASEQAQRLEKLVRNILNLSKIEGGGLSLNWGWISVPELLSLVVGRFSKQAAGRIQLHLAKGIPEIKGDFTLLSQVLANLLDNALKFSQAPSAIRLEAWSGEAGLYLSVSDSGYGVASADTDRIFEKFYRGATPVSVPGSGLGLNICKGIVELHKGSIAFTPVAEGGSCFTLVLPTQPSQAFPYAA